MRSQRSVQVWGLCLGLLSSTLVYGQFIEGFGPTFDPGEVCIPCGDGVPCEEDCGPPRPCFDEIPALAELCEGCFDVAQCAQPFGPLVQSPLSLEGLCLSSILHDAERGLLDVCPLPGSCANGFVWNAGGLRNAASNICFRWKFELRPNADGGGAGIGAGSSFVSWSILAKDPSGGKSTLLTTYGWQSSTASTGTITFLTKASGARTDDAWCHVPGVLATLKGQPQLDRIGDQPQQKLIVERGTSLDDLFQLYPAPGKFLGQVPSGGGAGEAPPEDFVDSIVFLTTPDLCIELDEVSASEVHELIDIGLAPLGGWHPLAAVLGTLLALGLGVLLLRRST